MNYTDNEWKELAKRFNEKGFLGKLMLIKQNPKLFKLEIDNGWMMLRLHSEEAMEKEFDMWFQFPNELSSSDITDLFWVADIKTY